MKDLKTLFGKKVKEFRTKKSLTQELLCEVLNISPQALSNIENGHTFPSYRIFVALTEILGVSAENFFVEKNENENIEFQILFSEYKKLNSKQKKLVLEIIKNINEADK